MTALVLAVFVASVMGSLHCAGMCGAFVAFAVGLDGSSGRASRSGLQAAYHFGRLFVYMMLGGVAGSLGRAFDVAGEAVGVQRAAVALAGASMVVFGTLAILRLNGVRLPSAPVPALLKRAAAVSLRFAVERPPLLRAALTGLFTTLLPCGWLYAFVITAGGSGGAVRGAVVMAVFWAGTLPVLVGIGSGVQAVAHRLGAFGRRVPVITAAMIVLVGLFNVFDRGRSVIDASEMRMVGDASVERVRALSSQEMPCCDEHPGR
ncbi:MAG: sulfite exporter TauE/SafE family protein [Phycisphaerae bacterium]|nr:sulfite exporter TauE/SafE family protein [Phycisphaerae bacterium]